MAADKYVEIRNDWTVMKTMKKVPRLLPVISFPTEAEAKQAHKILSDVANLDGSDVEYFYLSAGDMV